jgi:oligosaccharide repeat unit polymerase
VTQTGFILFFFLATSFTLSFLYNKDIFSPIKLYMLHLLVYFFNIFTKNQIDEVYYAYFFYIILGYFFVFIEFKILLGKQYYCLRNNIDKKIINEKKIVYILIVFAFIGLAARIYYVYTLGGLLQYVSEFNLRLLTSAGLGHIKLIINFLSVSFLMFLIIFFNTKIKKRIKYRILLILFFLLLVFSNIFTGSRGTILMPILTFLVFFNYFVKNIKMHTAVFCLLIFLISAIFIGAIRSNIHKQSFDVFQYSCEKFEDSLQSNTSITRYGVRPLDTIYRYHFNDLEYGRTFLTLITNYIPRKIWPGKPDSGGVILTDFYYGYRSLMTSNFSTGILTESIINFGYYFGPIFTAFFMLVYGYFIINLYNSFLLKISFQKKRINKNINEKTLFVFFGYFILFQSLGGITSSEFTHLFFSISSNVLLFFAIIGIYKFIHQSPTIS